MGSEGKSKGAAVRKLTVESKIAKGEDIKDAAVLTEIASNLPSASKVRVYKIDDTGAKKYIKEVPADTFDSDNPHEFIKSKFAGKFGGGEYYIELIGSNKDVVHDALIELIDEKAPDEKSTGHIKVMEEALDMKANATDDLIKAKDAQQEVEKEKHQNTVDLLQSQFSQITEMFKGRVDELRTDLRDAKEGKSDASKEMLLDIQIKALEREMQQKQDDIRRSIEKEEKSSGSSDKVFDLVSSLIPALINKNDKPQESPIQTITEVMGAIHTMTGGNGDTIDDIMNNPMKMKMFKDMMGISEEPKKDFFEEIMERPDKAIAFKKMMGIEDTPKKSAMDEMLESAEKMKLFQTMFAPQVPINQPPVNMEPKKDTFEQMAEMVSKLTTMKPVLMNMLGVQQTPVRNFTELLGTLASNLAPHIATGVTNVMNSMVTMEMIKKGMYDPTTGEVIKQPQAAYAGAGQDQVEKQVLKIKKPPKATKGMKEVEKAFENIVMDVTGSIDEKEDIKVFIDKIISLMLLHIKEHPKFVEVVSADGNLEVLVAKMSSAITKVAGFQKTQADEIAIAIAQEILINLSNE